MTWQLVYTKQAQKDAKKLAQSNLRDKAQALPIVMGERTKNSRKFSLPKFRY